MERSANDYDQAARDFYGPQADEFPKAVWCPNCKGEKYVIRSIFTNGVENEEEESCEGCNADGKVWVWE